MVRALMSHASLPLVVNSSYGNDSIALLQLCREVGARNVTAVFHDTGWARTDWMARVERGEAFARSCGFTVARTMSKGLEKLVRDKKGWPRQGIQFCTVELKIVPAIAWLEDNDPERRAVCLVGVRREESANRSSFPMFQFDSKNHGGRLVFAPMVDHTEEQRNALIACAGFDVLPHRSMECAPCINSNKSDLRSLTEDEIAKVERIESDLGVTSKGKPRTMFRPYRHMGATGIREIIKWAHTGRGEYDPTEGAGNCDTGFCGR